MYTNCSSNRSYSSSQTKVVGVEVFVVVKVVVIESTLLAVGW